MKTTQLSPAIKLSNTNEVYFHFRGDVKNHDDLIKSAKRFCYGMDGCGGYNFKPTDTIILGEVDISLKYGSDIKKSFKPINKELSSSLLR